MRLRAELEDSTAADDTDNNLYPPRARPERNHAVTESLVILGPKFQFVTTFPQSSASLYTIENFMSFAEAAFREYMLPGCSVEAHGNTATAECNTADRNKRCSRGGFPRLSEHEFCVHE